MKIAIIGGGGYLGSALLKHLAKRHTCVCFGHGDNFRKLRSIIKGKIKFVRGDVSDDKAIKNIVADADVTVYAAGTGGQAACISDPVNAFLSHLYGMHLFLKEINNYRNKIFIFLSSIAVYGGQRGSINFREKDDLHPDNFYSTIKFIAENEIIDSGKYQIFRLANVYGHGSGLFPSSKGIIEKFVEAIQRKQPLIIYGDGEEIMDLVHIDDVCRAIALAINCKKINFIYNLGGGRPISVKEIANIFRDIAYSELGIKVKIKFRKSEEKRNAGGYLSIGKIKKGLGWQPKIRLEDGIKEILIKWARKI